MSSKGCVRSSSPDDRYDDRWDDEGDELDFEPKYVQWSSSDGTNFMPASKTAGMLPPGVYEIVQNPNTGIYFEKIPTKTEGLIKFPGTKSKTVVEEIKKFWEREEIFKKFKLTYKRGIILYGPPGSGKSCTLQLIMQDVVHRGGVVLKFDHPLVFIDGLRILRQIQPDTPVVAIMEDIDAILEQYNESMILNILDGVHDIHKVVFLATTNYPKKLGLRVINRPSRFDKRFKIGFPSAESRRMYFEHLIGEENLSEFNIDLDRWVKDTDKLSIAHLKELFVAVVILGDKYSEAIKTLKSMKEDVEDKDYESGIGFVAEEDEADIYD